MAHKKSILINSFDFSLENGGIQNTGYLLAQYLVPYFEVFIFCTAGGNSPQIEGVHSFKSKHNSRNKIVFELLSLHKKYHFDFTLATNYFDATGLFFLKLLSGVPYGVMIHGNELLNKKDMGLSEKISTFFLHNPFRKLLLSSANHIFSNTDFTKGLLEPITVNRKITVIHPPISMESYKGDLVGKPQILLTISRLNKRKGIQTVIKVMPTLLQSYPEMKYIVAGKGDYEMELRNLVHRLDLDNSVIFEGFITEMRKEELFRECGLFIMPSIYIPEENNVEGFGISLVEANAYGKFVVSCRTGGVPEAVIDGKTGFMIDENNESQLVEAVLRFYNDFEYNATDCKKWANEHHISSIAAKYAMVINGII